MTDAEYIAAVARLSTFLPRPHRGGMEQAVRDLNAVRAQLENWQRIRTDPVVNYDPEPPEAA